MGVQVKICGVNDRAAAEAVLRVSADFAGLVFFPPSPRHVKPEQARAIGQALANRIRVVGLFVDPADDVIRAALSIAPLDLIQLHGQETPERTAAIAAQFGKPIIKAISVAETSDLARVPAYESVADYLMFDAKAPAQA